jgi:hypothetical protein
MPYNDHLKAVFLHVPKTGGTAIKRLLGINQLNSENPALIPSPQHLTCALLRAAIGPEKYDSYFKFTFVRNPWSRLVSDYFWRQGGSRRRMDMTFSEFTAYVADLVRTGRFYDQRFDDHFIPQVKYTRDVDRIYRFEAFADGVKSAARLLGVEIEEVPEKRTRPYDNYWEFYDAASKARVEAVYREDIDAFGYEFEG